LARIAKKEKELVAYVDGASRGNPGPAACGVVIKNPAGEVIDTLGLTIGVATNNVAEYTALILAMQETLFLGAKKLTIFTDSELVAKQWSGEYKVKEASLKVLFVIASHLKRGFQAIRVSHIPREQNKLADEAANRALNQEDLFK
jgi:ribonuclease HI